MIMIRLTPALLLTLLVATGTDGLSAHSPKDLYAYPKFQVVLSDNSILNSTVMDSRQKTDQVRQFVSSLENRSRLSIANLNLLELDTKSLVTTIGSLPFSSHHSSTTYTSRTSFPLLSSTSVTRHSSSLIASTFR